MLLSCRKDTEKQKCSRKRVTTFREQILTWPFPPLPLMPLFEVGLDFLFPICPDGCRAVCLPHPADRFADHMVVDRHALCVILEPHSPVGRDAEAGSFLHGVHVGTEEQEFPAVPFFFPLDHPADLLVAEPLAGVFQSVGGDDKDDLFGTFVFRQMALDVLHLFHAVADGIRQGGASVSLVSCTQDSFSLIGNRFQWLSVRILLHLLPRQR